MRRWLTITFSLCLAGIAQNAGIAQQAGIAQPTGTAQQGIESVVSSSISYISGGTVYLDAGRTRGLEAGDTLSVARRSIVCGSIVITAVSSSSSSAAVVAQTIPFAIGDSVWIRKPVAVRDTLASGVAAATRSPGLPGSGRESNIVSGRVAVQYGAVGDFGKALEYSQPAAVLRLDVGRLFGSELSFTMHGRTSYDLTDQLVRSRTTSRTQNRIYELSVSSDRRESWYGFGIGRIYSRYVGGLGTFDGGQVFARMGLFTAGVLAGAQPDYSTSSVNFDQQKYSAFVNYAWGSDIRTTSDITLAYGQQRVQGKLDRDFFYLQTSLRFGSDLFVYQSSELDLHTVKDGLLVDEPEVTNTFLTVNYLPLQWLSVTAGYDAARAVHLFESMKSIADTLLDLTLKEGFRGSLSFRLPYNLTLSTSGNFRLASGSTPAARTLAATVRAYNVFESQVNAGAHVASVEGLYTSGKDITLNLDARIGRSVSGGFTLDRYEYRVGGEGDTFRTTTGSANIQYWISRSLYGVMTLDEVWDTSRTFQRIFLELGVHF